MTHMAASGQSSLQPTDDAGQPGPPAIVLCTLNARYIHASLGLRYLLANMDRHGGTGLRAQTVLREFTINRPSSEVVQALLELLGPVQPNRVQVLGLGVYIWNTAQTLELVRQLKAQRPTLKVVLGGPEVSHEWQGQEIVQLSDHLITGWGDVSFPKLCQALLYGPPPLMKVIAGEQPPLAELDWPYAEYSDTDLAQRVLYVEASRGCPFKCEFCLSSLDKTAWAFEQQGFLDQLAQLYARGARTFKFVDRTFNLKVEDSARILQFFLDRLAQRPFDAVFVHFELIPDHLPQRLKDLISQFPAGVLQFEIGIQSFNPEVQQRISRKQDNAQTEANLRWLRTHSQAHLHTDLIFGLPGEDLASFAQGFDRLYALGPHEIQLGLLKRLRGTPIARHTANFGMVYDEQAPYALQENMSLSALEVQGFVRLARYWDLLANSGRFEQTLPLLMGTSPFWAFWHFSAWLWDTSQQTSGLTPEALVDFVFEYLTKQQRLSPERVRHSLLEDYRASGAKARPSCLRALLSPVRPHPVEKSHSLQSRQNRHAANSKPPTLLLEIDVKARIST
jgi:tRNA A37 methylthiotransferase MiaB